MPACFAIDKALTEQINRTLQSPVCECKDCQRYYQYMKQLPATAKEFFTESGIEPDMCQELWAYLSDDNGYTHYSGFFYIAVKSAPLSERFTITTDWKTLDYGFCSFQIRLEYLADGKPILGFEAHLPIESH